ncbi:unnamed protein product [Pedinophyceae sp. YPF-701]|nr:unnamed protein product [Pedinophyceae sp. YPF-701]
MGVPEDFCGATCCAKGCYKCVPGLFNKTIRKGKKIPHAWREHLEAGGKDPKLASWWQKWQRDHRDAFDAPEARAASLEDLKMIQVLARDQGENWAEEIGSIKSKWHKNDVFKFENLYGEHGAKPEFLDLDLGAVDPADPFGVNVRRKRRAQDDANARLLANVIDPYFQANGAHFIVARPSAQQQRGAAAASRPAPRRPPGAARGGVRAGRGGGVKPSVGDSSGSEDGSGAITLPDEESDESEGRAMPPPAPRTANGAAPRAVSDEEAYYDVVMAAWERRNAEDGHLHSTKMEVRAMRSALRQYSHKMNFDNECGEWGCKLEGLSRAEAKALAKGLSRMTKADSGAAKPRRALEAKRPAPSRPSARPAPPEPEPLRQHTGKLPQYAEGSYGAVVCAAHEILNAPGSEDAPKKARWEVRALLMKHPQHQLRFEGQWGEFGDASHLVPGGLAGKTWREAVYYLEAAEAAPSHRAARSASQTGGGSQAARREAGAVAEVTSPAKKQPVKGAASAGKATATAKGQAARAAKGPKVTVGLDGFAASSPGNVVMHMWQWFQHNDDPYEALAEFRRLCGECGVPSEQRQLLLGVFGNYMENLGTISKEKLLAELADLGQVPVKAQGEDTRSMRQTTIADTRASESLMKASLPAPAKAAPSRKRQAQVEVEVEPEEEEDEGPVEPPPERKMAAKTKPAIKKPRVPKDDDDVIAGGAQAATRSVPAPEEIRALMREAQLAKRGREAGSEDESDADSSASSDSDGDHGVLEDMGRSTMTMADLGIQIPKPEDVKELLARVDLHRQGARKQRQELLEKHRASFPRLAATAKAGRSVCLWGLGSKQALLSEFADALYSDGLAAPRDAVYVAKGHDPNASVRHIAADAAQALLRISKADALARAQGHVPAGDDADAADVHAGRSGAAQAIVDEIRRRAAPDGPALWLLVHNIDGKALRAPHDQAALAQLAALPCVHLVATVDHINAPLLWTKKAAFDFAWWFYEAATLEPYQDELQEQVGSLVGGAVQTNQDAAIQVLRSLPQNARKAFRVLAEQQLAVGGQGGERSGTRDGRPLLRQDDLLRAARRGFVATSVTSLGAMLSELIEHRIVTRSERQGAVHFGAMVGSKDSVVRGVLEQLAAMEADDAANARGAAGREEEAPEVR